MIKVDETDPVGELEPCFPYRDVVFRRNLDMKEWYELETEIGRGKFGTVYRCKERGTGLALAAKFVATPRREDRRNVEREVDIMRELQHPRLIQLYDAFDNGKTMTVVLELIEGGELFERVIDDDFVLTERACSVFMRQICEGIEFIHKQNILHLDMKPENILCLTRTGNRIKIIDFGLARRFDPNKKLQVLFGTPEFVAPEVVNFDQIGFGTDMWSVGVICYVLLSGLSPFMGDTDIETMANVTIAKYDFDDEAFDDISSEAKDFIERLLHKDQSARFTASQCIAHPWLRRRPPPAPAAPPPPPVVEVHVEASPEPPSPQPLEVTKDNLRGFVERWSEHPNSPYLFDSTCHSISLSSLALAHQASQQSMRMCTPSPQGSLPSSPDSVIELDNNEDFEHYSFQDQPSTHGRFLERLHMERRASDSSCLPNRAPTQQVSPVNLAEEIRRLSDRLIRMVKEIPTDIVNNNSTNNIERTQKFRVSEVNSRDVPLSMIKNNPMPPPSSPCTLRSLSSSSGTSQSLPSSPTSRLSPELTPPSTRELVLHLQRESQVNQQMHQQVQHNTQQCTMRWGQIQISMEHMSRTTIKSMKSIFESSSSEFTSNTNSSSKKDQQQSNKQQRVPLKLA